MMLSAEPEILLQTVVLIALSCRRIHFTAHHQRDQPSAAAVRHDRELAAVDFGEQHWAMGAGSRAAEAPKKDPAQRFLAAARSEQKLGQVASVQQWDGADNG